MAESNSRLFTPPYSKVPDDDSMLVRVQMDSVPHGARKSQTGQRWDNGAMAVKHVNNGR